MTEEYRFVSAIGEGAFARVYLAEDGKGRRYACKVSRERKILEREREILRGLYHPLFPAYAGYEERDGEGRLFMEYIPGRTLGQMARMRGGFSARQVMEIAGELADGLWYLHERQRPILYRDLKPDNIMVCQNGHVKLIDFGCACYLDAQEGVRVGTPGFAPPEQLEEGITGGFCSDIYGLGRTIQSVMAGGIIYTGKGAFGSVETRQYREKRKRLMEEKKCRQRLELLTAEAVCENRKRRPQEMMSVYCILTGKRVNRREIICEKNIWESSYKNSCSLPLI